MSESEPKKDTSMSASVPSVPQLDPQSNLSRYLQDIRKFPLLEPNEEFMLAKSWREHGDSEAAHRLVTSHLRLVAKIATGYRGYGLPMGELISEGNVGMMQAVKRFDPDRGFRLATYAMWWIRAAIQEYILHSWSLVKIGTTATQKKLFFNLRRIKGEIQAIEEGDLHPENVAEIAQRLNVSEADVVQMNRRMAAPDNSLNAPLRADGEGEWMDWLVDEAESQEDPTVAEAEDLARRREHARRRDEGFERTRTRGSSDEPAPARGTIALSRSSAASLRGESRERDPPDRGPRLREDPEGDARRRDRGTAAGLENFPFRPSRAARSEHAPVSRI